MHPRLQCFCKYRDPPNSSTKQAPLIQQAVQESVGARQEALRIFKCGFVGSYLALSGSDRSAELMWRFLESEEGWGAGPGRQVLMGCAAMHIFGRHSTVMRTIGLSYGA